MEKFNVKTQRLQRLIRDLSQKNLTVPSFFVHAFRHYHNLSTLTCQLFDEVLKILKFFSLSQKENTWKQLEKTELPRLILLNAKNYDELKKEVLAETEEVSVEETPVKQFK